MNAELQNYLVLFINLFFVPVISLYLAFKKRKLQDFSHFQIFMRYALYVVENLILTHVYVVIARILLHFRIYNTGVTYTVLAVISAFLIPILENSYNKLKEEKPEDKK